MAASTILLLLASVLVCGACAFEPGSEGMHGVKEPYKVSDLAAREASDVEATAQPSAPPTPDPLSCEEEEISVRGLEGELAGLRGSAANTEANIREKRIELQSWVQIIDLLTGFLIARPGQAANLSRAQSVRDEIAADIETETARLKEEKERIDGVEQRLAAENVLLKGCQASLVT